MKRIIEIPEEVYKTVQDGSYCGSLYEELKASIPYNPSGDLISREALKKAFKESEKYHSFKLPYDEIIDSVQTVEPEITEKQAILYLINNGWLVNHDKELREKWERPKYD